ncbi:unnamed protein product, partial [Allacma fusca]
MNQDKVGTRHTLRSTAGKPPLRHGDLVSWDKLRKQRPVSTPFPGTSFDCRSYVEPLNRIVTENPNMNSKSTRSITKGSNSVKSHFTKGSEASFRTTESSMRRLNLQVEVRTQTELNRLADEEDEINATITRLELQKKRL